MVQETYLRPENHRVDNDGDRIAPVVAKKKSIFTLKDLRGVINSVDSSDRSMAFFRDCRIYLHNPNSQDLMIQRMIITAGGGYESSQLLPFVTHVICSSCSDADYSRFKASRNVHVVNMGWLVESLKYKNRASEDNYMMMPTK